MKLLRSLVCLVGVVTCPNPGAAWDAHGHELVGAIAERLLTPNAQKQVTSILGYDLASAAKWPDCVRSVERTSSGAFRYNSDTPYQSECVEFMSPSEVSRMESYARRNWSNCPHTTGRGCHESYHFVNIAIQRGGYSRSYYGATGYDVVGAITAAIVVLDGGSAPSPFSIRDRKDALLMLAHFVGDIHQPLHVGSVYLRSSGQLVDPEQYTGDVEKTNTRGGNSITLNGRRLHAEWDDIPDSWTIASKPTLVARAKSEPLSPGQLTIWPALWASESVKIAQSVFSVLRFEARQGTEWPAVADNPTQYKSQQDQVKLQQLAKAGARLAAILNTLWP